MKQIYDSGYKGDCNLEDTDLMALVAWFDYSYPQLSHLLVHVANESMMPVQGRVKAKRKGVRRGFPDLMLLKRNSKYSGLMLELKRKDKSKGRPSKDQKMYNTELSEENFACTFCYGLDQAKECVKEYLQTK
tara:strand:+ start:16511 stop:16906 length:396 start_codon:yes stop_codon:yes gene_type:complete